MTSAEQDLDRYAAEAADPYCLDPDRATTMLAGRPWQRLVILGDSVTAGVMGPSPGYRERSFSDRLVDALAATRPGFAATNLATPFLRVAEIRDQQLEAAVAHRPDLVLVSAGGNDCLARWYDPDRLAEELDSLLVPLAGTGALVVTIGLFDLARSGLLPPARAEAMAALFDELDRTTARITRRIGGLHVDTHHHPLAADPDLYAADGIHGNARGHAVAFAAIVETLTRPSPAPAPPSTPRRRGRR